MSNEVTADGQLIKLVQKSDKQTLEITEFVVENDLAKTTFRYKVEGIRGTSTLRKIAGT